MAVTRDAGRQFFIATIPPTRLVGYERVERVLTRLNETLGSRESSGDDENVQSLRDRGEPMSTDEFAKTIRALSWFHDTAIDYASITVPILVLYGENEPGFIHAHAARFADLIADVQVRTVPNAGHASNMDNPDFYVDVLREFLPWCFDASEATTPDTSRWHGSTLSPPEIGLRATLRPEPITACTTNWLVCVDVLHSW